MFLVMTDICYMSNFHLSSDNLRHPSTTEPWQFEWRYNNQEHFCRPLARFPWVLVAWVIIDLFLKGEKERYRLQSSSILSTCDQNGQWDIGEGASPEGKHTTEEQGRRDCAL